ncbi:MAG: hypothetical protein KF880_05580 [Ferruginibacter sp.]|nr:hypothetical protein [Ferruginibacter sp.]
MIRNTILTITLYLFTNGLFGQDFKKQIVTSDIDNFWNTYDRIIQSSDSLERIKLINELYIDKGTEGLKGLISVRRYQNYEFVQNILNYPKFWNSIRGNSAYLLKDTKEIEKYLRQLKEIYPELKPANIYFSIGAFRSGGTYEGNKVLFGAEYMLAQKNTILEELPERIQKAIKEYAPYDIPRIAIHEYIHTQQKGWENQSIIHRCVAEGVAEFVSTLITKKPLSPPIRFGKQHTERVLERYMVEIFRDDDIGNWLWSENQNELKENDLGYYIGYEICERYYNNATDKKKAIKELIELDYGNEVAFAKLIDGTNFLPMTWKEIGNKYESMRPTVNKIVEFKNGSNRVSPKLKLITVEFSNPMSDCCRSIDLDQANEVEPLVVKKYIGWSDDKKRYTIEVEDLKPNTTYGLVISNFSKEDGGNRLAPYTIRFKTK